MRDLLGNIIRADPFTGKKKTKKQIKRDVLEENREKGKYGEDTYRLIAMANGEELERAPRGRDFISRKRNPFTGKVRTTHVEVKSSSTAPLSKLQKKTKKKRTNYKVVRVNPLI